ncbi:MAG TPA: PAS domain S-box protein [Candidatus Acidoferrum sp.]|nr:PAS domain S-box protein [Candidatus Acidoferrum sp.]
MNARVKRCAVCKIDLKGRFVFIDDASEQLFGRTKEDLFGRPFVNFVSEADKEVVRLILNQRNHYESFFERTPLELVCSDGRQVPAIAVISLNYLAGIPVNFQIIINANDEPDRGQVATATETVDQSLIEAALGFDGADWKQVMSSMRSFVDAEWAVVYWVVDGRLETWNACSRTEPGGASLETVPPTTQLHLWILENHDEYSFADHNAVRRAIERHGAAPNEFVSLLTLPESGQFLLRFIFPGDCGAERIERSTNRARISADLIRRLYSDRSAVKRKHKTSG